jgi:hypothetical protein
MNRIKKVIYDVYWPSTRSLQDAVDLLGIDQAMLWRRRKQYGI